MKIELDIYRPLPSLHIGALENTLTVTSNHKETQAFIKKVLSDY